MSAHHNNEHDHPIVPYKTYGIILVILLFLTFLTIAVTRIELNSLTVFAALLLASVKSVLVLYYFMHIKFDSPFIKIMVAAVFAVIAVLIVITYLDYFYRG